MRSGGAGSVLAGRARRRGADRTRPGQAGAMTTPEPDLPQPRDIALEMEDEETAAHLEAESDPEPGRSD